MEQHALMKMMNRNVPGLLFTKQLHCVSFPLPVYINKDTVLLIYGISLTGLPNKKPAAECPKEQN